MPSTLVPALPCLSKRVGIRIGILCLVVVTTIAVSFRCRIAISADLADHESYLESARADWEVPGFAVAVVQDDQIVYARGFGVKRVGSSEPVDQRTLFAIGSASKAFTAASLAMLIQDKKLNWDDKVTEHLPQFELFDPYVTRELTVRDLLCHRSGLSRGDRLWYGTEFSRDEILHRIRYLEPTWSFRSYFGYQNIMYLAAGQLVPAIAGESWDEFVRDRLFSPLGMSESVTSIQSVVDAPQAATPHAKKDGEVIPIPWRDLDNVGPAGSINSNVLDMAQWLRFHLAEGKFDGERLLRRSLIREMHTPQTVMRREGIAAISYPDANFLTYGLGWFLHDYHGYKIVRHGGAIDGMRALVAMIPEEQIGVVVLTNLNRSMFCVPVTFRIFDALLERPDRDWSGELHEAYARIDRGVEAAAALQRAGRKKETTPSLPLEEYTGTYSHRMYGEIEIQIDSGKLKYRRGPEFVGELDHWHYDTFEVTYENPVLANRLIAFRLNVHGAVVGVDVPEFAEFDRVKMSTKSARSSADESN